MAPSNCINWNSNNLPNATNLIISCSVSATALTWFMYYYCMYIHVYLNWIATQFSIVPQANNDDEKLQKFYEVLSVGILWRIEQQIFMGEGEGVGEKKKRITKERYLHKLNKTNPDDGSSQKVVICRIRWEAAISKLLLPIRLWRRILQ